MTRYGGAGGYGQPPVSGQFRKGRSGNPAGRPKGRHAEPPYESVLGQKVKFRIGREEKEATAEEAFVRKLAELSLKGSNAAARSIEKFRELRMELDESSTVNAPIFEIHFVEPGSVSIAVEPLKIASRLDRHNEPRARMMIEPWAVEAALKRFGSRKLSREDQATVLAATRTPKKVNWPDWWEVFPEE